MNLVTVSHRTTYRYRSPVVLGEHEMMLRPRGSRDMRVVKSTLSVSPDAELSVRRDAYGNRVETARFTSSRISELTFLSEFQVLHRPRHRSQIAAAVAACPMLPLSAAEISETMTAREATSEDPAGKLASWAAAVAGQGNAFEQACRISEAIHVGTRYARRESLGTQDPLETLGLETGTCRDLAYLLVEASRRLGYPARFVSGYLYSDAGSEELVGGHSTHAWAQIHMPGAGWVDFDPTNDLIGGRNLVASAWVMQPSEASPVHGSFKGWVGACLPMEVDVAFACRRIDRALQPTAAEREPVLEYSAPRM